MALLLLSILTHVCVLSSAASAAELAHGHGDAAGHHHHDHDPGDAASVHAATCEPTATPSAPSLAIIAGWQLAAIPETVCVLADNHAPPAAPPYDSPPLYVLHASLLI